METVTDMFERVVIDINEMQSDLSSAEAREGASAEEQEIANALWDLLEWTLEQATQLERNMLLRRKAIK